MRYIKFVKAPCIPPQTHETQSRVHAKITIVSDLGDTFFPYDVTLCATLLCEISQPSVKLERSRSRSAETSITVEWKSGMHELFIELVLPDWAVGKACLLWVGSKKDFTSSNRLEDIFGRVNVSQGITGNFLSAWSDQFCVATGRLGTKQRRLGAGSKRKLAALNDQAESGTQRRLCASDSERKSLLIWESGTSYASHIWYEYRRARVKVDNLISIRDAGLGFAAYLSNLFSLTTETSIDGPLERLLRPYTKHATQERLTVLELGTGCGIVGIQLAQLCDCCDVTLTDLEEARGTVERNISTASPQLNSTIRFATLDWFLHDKSPDAIFGTAGKGYDLILVSDCTYNWDAVTALVLTMSKLASTRTVTSGVTYNPTLFVVAMKRRHEDEDRFFEVMSQHGFNRLFTELLRLAGDEEVENDEDGERVQLVSFELSNGDLGRLEHTRKLQE